MKLPLVSRAVHEARIEGLQALLEQGRIERDYWKQRAEYFIDIASAQAGVAHQPVMADRPSTPMDALTSAFAGAAMTEFDSSKTS